MHTTICHTNTYDRMWQARYHQGGDLGAGQDSQSTRGGPEGQAGVHPKLPQARPFPPELYPNLSNSQISSCPQHSLHADSSHLHIMPATVTGVMPFVTIWGGQSPYAYT